MDPEERARRERERIIKDRERLRFRVYAAVRDVVLATELFRSHFELHEPEINVNVYAHVVDVYACLNEGQLRLLRESVRSRDLTRFAEELRKGIERAAAGLQLGLSADPDRLGGSQPVMLADAPCGYRALLLRRERE